MSRNTGIIKPRGDNVIIARFPKGAQKTKEGIHLLDSTETPFDIAEIVAVGPGAPGGTPTNDLEAGMQVFVTPKARAANTGVFQALDVPMEYHGRPCDVIASFQIMGIIINANDAKKKPGPDLVLCNGKD